MKDPKSLLSGRSGDPDARLGDSLPLRETSLYKSGRVDISAAHGSWDEQSINSTEFHGKRYLQWAVGSAVSNVRYCNFYNIPGNLIPKNAQR